MSVNDAAPKIAPAKKVQKENMQNNHKAVKKILKSKYKEKGPLQASEPIWELPSQTKKTRLTKELNLNLINHESCSRSIRNTQNDVGTSRPTGRRKSLAPVITSKTSKMSKTYPSPAESPRSNQNALELNTTRDSFRPIFPDEHTFHEEVTQESASKFFDCDQKDSFFRKNYPNFESFDLSSEADDFKTCCNFTDLTADFDISSSDIPLPEQETLNCSAKILSNFRNLLEQHKTNSKLLEPNDISILKDIVKADERHREMRKDDFAMLKEILKSQLLEIHHHEKLVKMALEKLRLKNQSTYAAEQPLEKETESAYTFNAEPEVDLVFRNVPTLEKEIEILKSLGAKLEATLKKTVSDRELPKKETRTMHLEHYTKCESTPSLMTYPIGVRFVTYTAEEFDIRQQSIDDLKKENGSFFLPKNSENFELQPTTFEKLAETPEFLQVLKSVNPTVAFNVIEQDPIFFDSLLVNWSKQGYKGIGKGNRFYIRSKSNYKLKSNFDSIIMGGSKCGAGGDHLNSIGSLRITAPVQESVSNLIKPKNDDIVKLKKKIETKFGNRKRNRKDATRKRKQQPKCILLEKCEKTIELPRYGKNFLKTVLAGSAQIIIFLLMIMAFTYPDMDCF